MPQLFSLGHTVVTRLANATLEAPEVLRAVGRHLRGDWGDVSAEDALANDVALRDGLRLVSAYTSRSGVTFLIITEADRSVTTILLRSEY